MKALIVYVRGSSMYLVIVRAFKCRTCRVVNPGVIAVRVLFLYLEAKVENDVLRQS